MKKELTELVMILDRSGSMQGLEPDTIGGFNGMIQKQKEEKGDALVTTILFDDEIEFVHDRAPLTRIEPMTAKQYYVRGCTALLDAIGTAVEHIEKIHRYAREEDRPEKTIFVITTDGQENASKHFDYAAVKRMVEQRKEKDQWEFLFLGANIDAVEVAGQFGIHADRAVQYHSDKKGTKLSYKVLGQAVSAMRARGCESVGADWKQELEEDFEQREKGS